VIGRKGSVSTPDQVLTFSQSNRNCCGGKERKPAKSAAMAYAAPSGA
jgi:hypothetical protein